MDENLRVVIVDDHEFAREAVAAMIDAEPGLEIVGQADSVWQAREVISRLVPDVAVLDFNLPDGSGGDLVQHFAVELPELRCVIFTSLVDQTETDALLAAGAEAVILKTLRGTDLVDAIRRVDTSNGHDRDSAPAR